MSIWELSMKPDKTFPVENRVSSEETRISSRASFKDKLNTEDKQIRSRTPYELRSSQAKISSSELVDKKEANQIDLKSALRLELILMALKVLLFPS